MLLVVAFALQAVPVVYADEPLPEIAPVDDPVVTPLPDVVPAE